jgi:hypothetical protein
MLACVLLFFIFVLPRKYDLYKTSKCVHVIGLWVQELSKFVACLRKLREAAYLSGRADDTAAKKLLENVWAAYESAVDELIGGACVLKKHQIVECYASPSSLATSSAAAAAAFSSLGFGPFSRGRASSSFVGMLAKASIEKLKVLAA